MLIDDRTITELRRGVDAARVHPESLLNVPLIRQAFTDTGFQFLPRSTDCNWSYCRTVPITLTGFNPFQLAYYYGQSSRFAAWLTDPFGSAREFNEGDFLLQEVLFMTHDYLHAWAYSVIEELCPSLGVLHGDITSQSFDDYVFCHLLTETVATIGLDYWFLCRYNINQFCPIGSDRGPLTVRYRESRLPEYRRFCPDLDIQTPDFFRTLAVFYCSGHFPGFDREDLKRSPQLLRWLRHELSYGVTQRSLTREWMAYMAEEPIELVGHRAPKAPIDIDTELYHYLIDEVGARLWDKVSSRDRCGNDPIKLPKTPSARLELPEKPADFRFVNLARVPEEEWAGMQPMSAQNFKFFLYQFMGQIPYESVPQGKLDHLPLLMVQRDVSLVRDLMCELPRREALDSEPRGLMIAN